MRKILAVTSLVFAILLCVGLSAAPRIPEPVAASTTATFTTGTFDFVASYNGDSSALMAFVGDIVTKQSNGTKTKESFCRSATLFPNPVPAKNTDQMWERYMTYWNDLKTKGYVPQGWFNTTRALNQDELADFGKMTLAALADMVTISNAP